jgi:hypothetical protein
VIVVLVVICSVLTTRTAQNYIGTPVQEVMIIHPEYIIIGCATVTAAAAVSVLLLFLFLFLIVT